MVKQRGFAESGGGCAVNRLLLSSLPGYGALRFLRKALATLFRSIQLQQAPQRSPAAV